MNARDRDRDNLAAVETMAADIARQLHPLLAGRPPALQGATLAHLTATWLAGHPAGMTAGLLRLHLEAVLSFERVERQRLGT